MKRRNFVESSKESAESSAKIAEQMRRYTQTLTWANGILALLTLVIAAATIFQAYQAKRQADAAERALQAAVSSATPSVSYRDAPVPLAAPLPLLTRFPRSPIHLLLRHRTRNRFLPNRSHRGLLLQSREACCSQAHDITRGLSRVNLRAPSRLPLIPSSIHKKILSAPALAFSKLYRYTGNSGNALQLHRPNYYRPGTPCSSRDYCGSSIRPRLRPRAVPRFSEGHQRG